MGAISVQGYDEDRKVIYWNKGSESLYGFSKDEALGQTLESLIIPRAMTKDVIQAHSKWLEEGQAIDAAELVLCDKNKDEVAVYSSHVMFASIENKKHMYCIDINLNDIRKAQAQITLKENLLEAVLEATPDLFFVMEEDTTIVNFHANDEAQLYEQSESLIGRKMVSILPSEVSNKLNNHINKALQRDNIVEFGYELKVPSGIEYFEARIRHLKEEKQLVVVVRNITAQHDAAETIKKQAYFDTLTNLPNRFLALDRLSQIINDAQRSNEKSAVLFLDLDDFKKVNDSLGHSVGDQLLAQSAERLTQTIRKRDTVGRLGGDEFIVLLPDISDYHGLLRVAESLLEAFRKPFYIDNRELILTLSIGIAIYPQNGETATDLLRNADTAMYQAKASGRNAYSFFTKEMNEKMTRRFELEEQMHGALERGEFSLNFQTKMDTQSSDVVGAEALLRWCNPKLGRVTPDEFIPIAEHTGLIVNIGEFVLQESLKFLTKWEREQEQELHIAVNLSPRQFRDKGLVPFVAQALKDCNVEPKKLEFEITEGVLLTGEDYIKDTLRSLHDIGIKLSMDDFGTGYSSLSYLRQYSFHILKIDRSFIDGIVHNLADKKLVVATIAMAHSLGLKVVAEGVETVEQLEVLKELDCDYVQGFYFSKPLPQNEILNNKG